MHTSRWQIVRRAAVVAVAVGAPTTLDRATDPSSTHRERCRQPLDTEVERFIEVTGHPKGTG